MRSAATTAVSRASMRIIARTSAASRMALALSVALLASVPGR
ncbi:hypothetical protein [Streptomyces sp. NPDC097610]